MSKIQKAIDALDGCDEYSLRHHVSEVSILIEGYAEAKSELAALREELAESKRMVSSLYGREQLLKEKLVDCSQALTAAEQPAPVAATHPFADKVISKLQRFVECCDDGQGADIGRHWFDLLTQLGLLNRVQLSPALWEITQQGEDCLDKVKELNQ